MGRNERRFEKAFIRALRGNLPKDIEDVGNLMLRVRNGALRRWHSDADTFPDPATRGHHWAACLVLSSDRVLLDAIPDAEARLRAVQQALLQPGAALIKVFTRMMLVFSRDRFRTLTDYAEKQVPPRYGEAFTFTTLEASPDHLVQGVTRCFYNDYFRANGAPELIGLFCAFDRLWIDEIKPSRDKVAFERPTTLAEGDDCCRFAFRRVPGESNV